MALLHRRSADRRQSTAMQRILQWPLRDTTQISRVRSGMAFRSNSIQLWSIEGGQPLRLYPAPGQMVSEGAP